MENYILVFICHWQFWKADYFRSGESEALHFQSIKANLQIFHSKLLAEFNEEINGYT